MERVIDNSSPELFEEIVRTVPIIPHNFSFKMKIGSILLPKNPDEVGGYISSCERNNVMPFSYLGFDNVGSVFSLDDALFLMPRFGSANLCDLAALHVAKGGRPYEVGFKEMQDEYNKELDEGNKELFVRFRDKLFDTFLSEGYNIESGEMYVGESSARYYLRSCFLLLTRNEKICKEDGVYSDFLKNIVETDRTKIKEWLDGLKEKYDSDFKT